MPNTQPYYKGKVIYISCWRMGIKFFRIWNNKIVDCRFKGEWLSDLSKTKDVIDIYIKEYSNNYESNSI